ncbi:DNA topoisomerase III [Ottowia sp. GY511]|uniref:DNA topoisomerase n=1 Tax=Ottowia flava TaxID=2675430 RepID=A0ABW4KTV1_9BURK|nr:DNA topoisomerase III [Ottowia sp. GY511]TXK27101.1 DNA topoisomerase III [Ottowia sp. GY511]
MKTLVIAEKPSVAQDIVRALTPVAGKFDKHDDHFESERYVVTSAVGHLVEIQAPEQYDVKRGKWSFAHLPVIPPHFDLKPVDKTKTRLNAVVKLARRKDVTALINACDAGREGELIFRLIEQYAFEGKHAAKPVQRLWLQSMTPQAIRDGFDHLRSDQQMQGLADAARSRSEADWLVGINGTRAMTAFNSRDGGFFLTTVGRVQTPTLAVVVEREEQIRKHIARDYWEVHASFLAEAGEYAGKWFNPGWKKDPEDADKRADRVWTQAEAQAIADAVRGKACSVTEESKPSTQASPLLFDLTSLQREANGKFGFSAKTTLALAQSLYERHKALTYPRTDSRFLPEDYLKVARQTFEMLATGHQNHLAPYAKQALDQNYVKPTKRIFDNSKVSDHFAIIPTLQEPGQLSEAERKLYDLVVRRFMAVFFPSAEYQVTTRITTASHEGQAYNFQSNGKVLVKPGWLAIYGKEADSEMEKKEGESSKTMVPVKAGELVRNESVEMRALQTRPPARYSEATLLGAMEGAGKFIEDDELREAMQEKGLGTPATRAAIIEGLITEKYILREGREMIPTAKAFQLMTLLRGLQVDELTRPALTGDWEYKLAQMEKGQLSRSAFMQDIAAMTEHIVKKAKEYDRDTVPGDYATLATPCPHCGGIVKENYRRYACTGKSGSGDDACGFSFTKSPAGRTFEIAEAEALVRDKHIGPLEGFRSKAGWPFVAEIALAWSEEDQNWKLEFDFGDDAKAEQTGEIVDLSAVPSVGPCPKCGSPVKAFGKSYVCEKSVPTEAQPVPSCDFKSGQVILQQPVDAEQMGKLLNEGKTDLLDKFVSMRTRRAFKARLTWSAEENKVIFEFEPREGARKYPPRKTAATGASATKKVAARAGGTSAGASKDTKAPAAKKAPAKKTAAAAKTAKPKAPRAGTLKPSPALAAVIGDGPFGRGEVMKLLWDYIKAHNLQDPKDKRTILADDKLKPIFGADSVGMFKLAGIVGGQLS